jgi:hypothetical protein
MTAAWMWVRVGSSSESADPSSSVSRVSGQLQVLGGEDQGVEVAVGQDQAAVGAQDPDRLGNQGVRGGQDLEHVVAEHPVEGGVGQRQGRLEVGLEAQHPGPGGQADGRLAEGLGAPGQGGRGQVEPDQQPARDRRSGLDQRPRRSRSPGRPPGRRGPPQQSGQPVVPARHHRLDRRVDVVRLARHGRER